LFTHTDAKGGGEDTTSECEVETNTDTTINIAASSTFQYGQPAVLECTYINQAVVNNTKWLYENELLCDYQDENYSCIHTVEHGHSDNDVIKVSGNKISIDALSDRYSGIYTCILEENNGVSHTTTYTLTATAKLSVSALSSTTSLFCIASVANDSHSIVWFKDSVLLHGNNPNYVTNNSSNTLTIKSMQASDVGTFKCFVNRIRYRSFNVTLTVTIPPVATMDSTTELLYYVLGIGIAILIVVSLLVAWYIQRRGLKV